MGQSYYIASCVFTSRFPDLSGRIQSYVRERFGFPIVRCCVPSYKLREFEAKMPEGPAREAWRALPDCAPFQPGDTVWSLCHNCSNLIEELHPGVRVPSLWELLLQDDAFPWPDHRGETVTVQDCWRAKERREEQEAVREILRRMGMTVVELPDAFEKTNFCGVSLYQPQPPRNPKLAPRHYVDGAQGKFLPHTEEQQTALMEQYCRRFHTSQVVCYCHYCLAGLEIGGVKAHHLAQLLFGA